MTSPDPSPNPTVPPVEEPPRSRSRRRRSRSGSSTRGIIYLITFWVLLGCFQVWAYLGTADYEKRGYIAHEARWFIITTSLFFGVLCRQGWARYLLIGLMLFRLGATLMFIPMFTDAMLESFQVFCNVMVGPVLDAFIIWGLISIPSIRRLVSRMHQ